MASSTRSRANATNSVTQSLLGSEQEPTGLHGPVPPDTHNSLTRMARCFGLQTAQAVTTWLQSPAFEPYFQELYNNCIKPRQEEAAASNQIRKQGPQLAAVQNAIADGENFGDQKYSGYHIDRSEFTDIDHYALCLYRLRRENTDSRNGLFRNTQMTNAEKEARLWCAMLRATYDRASSRQHRQRKNTSASSSGSIFLQDATSSNTKPGPSLNKKQRLNFEGPKNIHERPDSETLRDQLTILLGKTSAGASTSSRANETKILQDQSNNDDTGRNDDNVGGTHPRPESNTLIDAHTAMDDFARMKSEWNSNNPFDLDTDYGRYITIHSVVKNFNDEFEIQRLFVTQAVPVENNNPALNDESRLWHDELEAIAKNQRFVICPASEEEVTRQDTMEKFFDNPKFQRYNYDDACRALGITDLQRPQFVGMPTTMVFRSWQVVGIHALTEFEKDPAIRAGILADSTGLGKTVEIIGYWYHRLMISESHRQAETSIEPPPAKPLLLIVPPELITQWAGEIRRFSNKFRPVVYYGDKRSSLNTAFPKVNGMLTKTSPFFNGDMKNARVVIITSLPTLVARHGPPVLRGYRINKKGWNRDTATQNMYIPDPDWEHDLSGVFDIVTIDEAHQIKNPDTAAHATIGWLKASFHILATASVLPNGISDFDGYMHFVDMNRDLWHDDNLARWKVKKSVNPFDLPDNHPAAVLRMTIQAVKTFITGEDANRENAGFYLQKVWERCLIRRTYASKDPKDINLGKAIGEALPRLQTRRIICRFHESEQDTYNKYSELPIRKLAHFLDNGRLVWNRKYARQLILNSTWLGFHWIGDSIHAATTKEWKATPDIMYYWIKLLHKKQGQMLEGGPEITVPDREDIPQQLAILLQGSPKLRHTLRNLAELVVLMKRKVVIWCGLPANQLLLLACCQALHIDCLCYTSELSHSERTEMVTAFTTQPNSAYVFIGGYNVGSVGLNLQGLCNHQIDFDSAPNKGTQDQATGRLRRLNQPYTVERFELSVEKSFQSRVIQNSLMKAVPGAIAELSMNVESSKGEDGVIEFSVGDWYLINNELVQAPDPRVAGLPAAQKLSPVGVIKAILDIQRGNEATVQGESPSWEAADEKVWPDPCDDEADFKTGGTFEDEHIDEEVTDDREAVEGFYSRAEAQDDAEDETQDKGFHQAIDQQVSIETHIADLKQTNDNGSAEETSGDTGEDTSEDTSEDEDDDITDKVKEPFIPPISCASLSDLTETESLQLVSLNGSISLFHVALKL